MSTAAPQEVVADHGAHAAAPVGRSGGHRGAWLAAGSFLLGEAVFVLLLRRWQPRFFYQDDKIAQYLPVWQWLGAQPGLRLPLIDPDQGSGGNFTGDLQYGVMDPFHWLLAGVLSRMDGLVSAAWGLHVLAVTVLGLGTVALATRLGARPVWALMAALGAANSGFLLWFGSSWWPAAWGTALLPWLWWALISPSRWALPVAAGSAYLLATSGYPYTLPFAALIVLGVVIERVLQHRRGAGAPASDAPTSGAATSDATTSDATAPAASRVGATDPVAVLPRLLAAAGGLLLAAPGLLASFAMAPFSQRAAADAELPRLGNSGDYIPNLVDVLVGGPSTSPSVTGWWGTILPPAAMATAWFVLPALALVRWRALGLRAGPAAVPGLVTGGLLCLAAVLATQTPTVVASLRFPFRYAVVLEVFLPVVVAVLASRGGLSLSRWRVVVAMGLLLAQGWLAVVRTPAVYGTHLRLLVVGLVVLAALVVLVRRGNTRVAAALAVVAVVAAPLASVAAAIAVERSLATAAEVEPTGRPADALYDAAEYPASVAGFRAAAWQPDLNASVVYWGGSGGDRGLSRGIPVGSAALFSGTRTGYGYTSVGQAGWADRWCQDYLGQSATCGEQLSIERLLAPAPGTGMSWMELLSKDVLLLDDRAPDVVRESLGERWTESDHRSGFTRFDRREPTPGRITWTSAGVTSIEADEVGPDDESYAVTWDEGGARVLTRIPWWPGYRATLDGEPLQLTALEATSVAVDLPAGGGSGQLRIWFEPPHRGLGLAAVAVGGVVTLGGLAWGLVAARRSRQPGEGTR